MIARNPANFHAEYMDVVQHWSPDSEKYGGGDALITIMMMGLELSPTLYMEYSISVATAGYALPLRTEEPQRSNGDPGRP